MSLLKITVLAESLSRHFFVLCKRAFLFRRENLELLFYSSLKEENVDVLVRENRKQFPCGNEEQIQKNLKGFGLGKTGKRKKEKKKTNIWKPKKERKKEKDFKIRRKYEETRKTKNKKLWNEDINKESKLNERKKEINREEKWNDGKKQERNLSASGRRRDWLLDKSVSEQQYWLKFCEWEYYQLEPGFLVTLCQGEWYCLV